MLLKGLRDIWTKSAGHLDSIFSVLINHAARARGGVDMMIGHTNAGASDPDRASIGLLGCIPALEDSLHLGSIDLEWL